MSSRGRTSSSVRLRRAVDVVVTIVREIRVLRSSRSGKSVSQADMEHSMPESHVDRGVELVLTG